MSFIFFDTSTDIGVIGLFSDTGTLLQKREFPAAFSNSKQLLPAIDELCRDVTLKFVAVGIGPGSYTGCRVAVATAKGISFAKGIPLVGISTLRGLVPENGHTGSFIGAIDARIGGIYALLEGDEEKLYTLEEFEKAIEKIDLIVTPIGGAAILKKRIVGLEVPIQERTLSLEELGRLSYDAFLQNRGVRDGNLPLLYLRKTQAEIEIAK